MTHKEYNGWTNYETWLVKLWIDNEQGTQDYFRDMARECLRTDKDDAIRSLADIIKENHEESLPELTGFAADLMNAALSEVNWEEIADSLLGDLKEEEEAA